MITLLSWIDVPIASGPGVLNEYISVSDHSDDQRGSVAERQHVHSHDPRYLRLPSHVVIVVNHEHTQTCTDTRTHDPRTNQQSPRLLHIPERRILESEENLKDSVQCDVYHGHDVTVLNIRIKLTTSRDGLVYGIRFLKNIFAHHLRVRGKIFWK